MLCTVICILFIKKNQMSEFWPLNGVMNVYLFILHLSVVKIVEHTVIGQY